jgi:uncharacterized protein (TIGR03437 family)
MASERRVFVLGWGLAALLGGLAEAQTQTQPTLSVNPTSLSFSYQTGATFPAEQKVQIKLSGATTALDYTMTVSSGSEWLIISQMTGKTGGSVGVRVNPTSLLAGSYTATVQVDAPGVSVPATFTVTLLVKNPPPTMTAGPATLAFNYETLQATPAAQTLAVSTNGEPVSFTAAASGGAWLAIDRTSGIALAGSPVTLTVSVVVEGLLPGSYTGRITLTSANASNKTAAVGVTLAVTAGTAVISSIWPNAAPVGSNDTTITIRGQNFFKTSAVNAGTTGLTATWVSTTVLLAVVPRGSLITQGALDVTVTNAPKPASNAATFTVTPPGPQIQGVVNAASFMAGSPRPTLAAGEIVSIFGSALGPGTLLQASPSGGAFPTALGTPPTIVEVEGGGGVWVAMPIIFAQANQINAVTPFGMSPAVGRRLRVTYNALTSAPVLFDAVAADPGIFTINSSGRGQAAVLNYNATTGAYSLNSDSNAAAKEGVIVIYLTGGGPTNPLPTPDGQVVPLTGSLPRLTGGVSVTIGGEAATVQSATLAPGSIAGLVQLNVTVPSTVRAGKDLAVVVTIAGRSSPATATVAVK